LSQRKPDQKSSKQEGSTGIYIGIVVIHGYMHSLCLGSYLSAGLLATNDEHMSSRAGHDDDGDQR
jgi:hypothetical protein